MDPDLDQLRALAAAVDHGSLDAAARALHVTPSAVSQRLRALESSTGQVLLVRSRPVRATPAGEVLVRLARQVDLLVGDARNLLPRTASDDLGARSPGVPGPVLGVAVNADSLATWALPALAAVARGGAQVRVRREDESRTAELLRDGTVVAAVTTQGRPVAGCRVTTLGALRYRAMCAPAFAERWFPDGATPAALGRAPVLVFDDADELQDRFLHSRGRRPGGRSAGPADGTGREPGPPRHSVPSSGEFVDAVVLGAGWAMLPDLQSAPYVEAGGLVEVGSGRPVDVVLHWQRWSLRSPSIDALTDAVVAAAGERLRPVRAARARA